MRARTATGEQHFWNVASTVWWVLCASLAFSARAQDLGTSTPPLDRIRLPSDGSGLLTTEGAAVVPHLAHSVAFALDYGHNPVVIRDAATGEVAGALVAHRVGGAFAATVGLLGRMSLGFELPLVMFQGAGALEGFGTAPLVTSGLAPLGIGDLRLVPKIQVLRQRRHFVNVAFLPVVIFPTATGLTLLPSTALRFGGDFLGERKDAFSLQPGLAISWDSSVVRTVGMLSYRLRPPLPVSTPAGPIDLDPELIFRAGFGAWAHELERALVPRPEKGSRLPPALAFLEVSGAISDRAFLSGRGDASSLTTTQRNIVQTSLEWHAGLRFEPPGSPWQITTALGGGLLRGLGTPDLRVVLQLRWQVPESSEAPPPA
ncbi:MAG: hypothetical protein ACO3JL_03255 [Myxococcota bacterium]